jgi:UDP-glucose:(heptosyl)LPS alpha-1,3-glucosyltransferase
VADRVCFVGATERISPYHHAADVLVHPSFYDPCSRVVLEGLVAGLPCITTRFDGASEVIEDGVNGFVIDDPRAVDALAERVRRLADPELRARVGRRAAELSERVSMRRHAEQMLAVYGELTGRGASA